MRYCLVEIEVTEPLVPVQLPSGYSGIAILIRHKGSAVAFIMRETETLSTIDPGTLSRWIEGEASEYVRQAAKRERTIGNARVLAPSLTIAICTRNRPDVLKRCLNRLCEVEGWPTKPEILVVDNAPPDDRSQQVVESFRSIRYLREPKPGLNFARNTALQRATGDLLAFVDDDAIVDTHYLKALHRVWRENPDAGTFTGAILPLELESHAQILFERRGGFTRGFSPRRYEVDEPDVPFYPCGAGMFGAGCNMVFRRSMLLEIDGFDEALDTGPPLPGGGDLDAFYRAICAGYPLVYEPSLLVFHQHRKDLKGLRHQMWTWGLTMMAFVQKSYSNNPHHRGRILKLVPWYLTRKMWHSIRSTWNPKYFGSPILDLAEFAGAIAGLCGEYGRSRKRVEERRRIHS